MTADPYLLENRERQAQARFDALAALFDELHEEGLQVRFAQHGGRVVASLCDVDGNVLRPLRLLEAIGGIDPETAA